MTAAAMGHEPEACRQGAQRLLDVYRSLQAEVLADHDERIAAAARLERELEQLRMSLRRWGTNHPLSGERQAA